MSSVAERIKKSQAETDAEALNQHTSVAPASTTQEASVAPVTPKVTEADVSRAVLDWVGPKIAASTEEEGPRTKKLQIAVTPAFFARVRQASKERGISISDFLRRLIERVLPE